MGGDRFYDTLFSRRVCNARAVSQAFFRLALWAGTGSHSPELTISLCWRPIETLPISRGTDDNFTIKAQRTWS
jgi:hypothetical protein